MVGRTKVRNMSEEQKERVLSFLEKRGSVSLKYLDSCLECLGCFSGDSKRKVQKVNSSADKDIYKSRFIVWVDSRSCNECYLNARPVPLYNIKLPEKFKRGRTLKLFIYIGGRYG